MADDGLIHASDDDILNDITENLEREDVDNRLKGWAERLNVMISNGFTEDRACKIISHMMLQSMNSNQGE